MAMQEKQTKNKNNIEKREDVRTLRTKRDLANALVELLREKNFDEVSVQEIVDRALIAKNTFYNNFSDKNDLLSYLFERMEKEAVKTVMPLFEEHKPLKKLIILKKLIETCTDFFYQSKLPLVNMIQNDESKAMYWNCVKFVRKFFDDISDYLKDVIGSGIDASVALNFYSGGFASLIYDSLLQGDAIPQKKLNEDLFRIVLPTISKF